MRQTIHLALTDDWELRGNGSGSPERLQFAPMRRLLDIYERHGVRATFNVEVMQQLAFRRFQSEHTELRALADAWDEHVRAAYRRGHDVQLHVHPQWSGARYADGRWVLDEDWSLVNYDEARARQMIAAGKEYLENLLRAVNPGYRCVAFRAGAWCLAPSPHLLPTLAALGIVCDVSIAAGLHYETRHISLDYRDCEETLLPFYPSMTDARRVSARREEIVCVPTYTFRATRRQLLRQHLTALRRRLAARRTNARATETAPSGGGYEQEWASTAHTSLRARLYAKGVAPYLRGKHFVADLSQFDRHLMDGLLDSIRRRARATGLHAVPFVLTNHTKDIADFSAIDAFLRRAARAGDIEFITLTQLADALRAGRFPIRKRVTSDEQSR